MLPVIYNFSDIDFDLPGKHHYQVAFHLDGTWGYSLLPLTVINGKRGPNANGVLCFGGTHGNEYEGQVCMKRLCTDLDPGQMAGRVVLIPQLSESACAANSRTSPLDGVNMNRAFPGNPRGTVSSRIANFVKTHIFPLGRVVIDIHAGGMEGAFPICASFHPIPDPAQRAEIATVSKLFDTGFALIYSSDMASGLLTDEAEAEGKVTLGGEFGAGASTDWRGVRHAYEGTRNVLRHYGLLDGEIVKIRPQGSPPTRLIRADKLDAYVPAPRYGVWEPVVQPGDAVDRGQLLGRLHDFSDHSSPALDILAPRAGFVAMLHLGARPLKGQTLFVVAENVDWNEVLH
jgi:predicted deacylase